MRARIRIIVLSVLPLLASGAAARANGLVDPTRPAGATDPVAAAPEPGEVRVQAIIRRDGSRVAVVDGRVVHAGDRIASVTIEEVTPDGVRYSLDGRSRFARLKCPTPLTVRHGAPAQRGLP